MNDNGTNTGDSTTVDNSVFDDLYMEDMTDVSDDDVVEDMQEEEGEIPSIIIPGEELDDFFGDGEEAASTTTGAPVVDAAAIYEPICYKLDLIIMLLIVIFAAYMFKGLANPYKLGGKHIGKSG